MDEASKPNYAVYGKRGLLVVLSIVLATASWVFFYRILSVSEWTDTCFAGTLLPLAFMLGAVFHQNSEQMLPWFALLQLWAKNLLKLLLLVCGGYCTLVLIFLGQSEHRFSLVGPPILAVMVVWTLLKRFHVSKSDSESEEVGTEETIALEEI